MPGQPGPFAFADAALVREVLTRSGFAAIAIEPREIEVLFGGARGLDEGVRYATNIGPAARFLASAEIAPDDPRVAPAIAEALRPYATDRGVVVPARIFIVTARRG